jgi:gluconokinase
MNSAEPHVLVVMGVSGSGKSTVARLLADRLGWDFAEGDDMHPQANKDKMAAGHPLDDQDRRPWLDKIAAWIRQHLDAGRPGIVTSSALKRVYRDRLRSPGVVFVHLTGTHDLIADRIGHRHGHFLPPCLLQSQIDTLEPPDADEAAVTVDVTPAPDDIVEEVLRVLHLTAAGQHAREEGH